MGILDDAIREHLDLKRRLGAASDELERLEKEAFGPPEPTRRGRLPGRRSGDRGAGSGGNRRAAAPGGVRATVRRAAILGRPVDLRRAAPPPKHRSPRPRGRATAAADAPPVEPPAAEPGSEAVPAPDEVEREEPADAAASLEQAAQDLDLDLDLDEEIEEVSDLDVELAPEGRSEESEPGAAADRRGAGARDRGRAAGRVAADRRAPLRGRDRRGRGRRGRRAGPARPAETAPRKRTARAFSRRRPSSSARTPTTTSCGSSKANPKTSTSEEAD